MPAEFETPGLHLLLLIVITQCRNVTTVTLCITDLHRLRIKGLPWYPNGMDVSTEQQGMTVHEMDWTE